MVMGGVHSHSGNGEGGKTFRGSEPFVLPNSSLDRSSRRVLHAGRRKLECGSEIEGKRDSDWLRRYGI